MFFNILKKLAGLLVLICLGVTAYVLTMVNRYPPVPDLPNPPEHIGAFGQGVVRAVFLGVSSFGVSDGRHTIVFDGFFSRPSKMRVAFGRLREDEPRIDDALNLMFQKLQVKPAISAVFVTHSHFDHLLDSPYIARRYKAMLFGSSSTLNFAKGQDVPDDKLIDLKGGQVENVGDFHIQAIPTRHAPTGFTGGVIAKPIELPVHALEMKEGTSYTYVISYGSDRKPLACLQSTAGFIPGQSDGVTCPVVFLGVGGLGKLSEGYMDQYWSEIVEKTHARQVYLIHWDDFTQPLMANGQLLPLKPFPLLIDNMTTTASHLKASADRDKIQIGLLLSFNSLVLNQP